MLAEGGPVVLPITVNPTANPSMNPTMNAHGSRGVGEGRRPWHKCCDSITDVKRRTVCFSR